MLGQYKQASWKTLVMKWKDDEYVWTNTGNNWITQTNLLKTCIGFAFS